MENKYIANESNAEGCTGADVDDSASKSPDKVWKLEYLNLVSRQKLGYNSQRNVMMGIGKTHCTGRGNTKLTTGETNSTQEEKMSRYYYVRDLIDNDKGQISFKAYTIDNDTRVCTNRKTASTDICKM